MVNDPRGGSQGAYPPQPGYPPQPVYGAPAAAGAGYPPVGGYPPPGALPPAGYGPGYAPGYGAPAYGPYAVQYAGFWIRFVATIIDAFVMLGIFLVLAITIVGILLIPVVGIAYQPYLWWKRGATFGQSALGLRVVRAYDGGPITGGQAVIRYLVKQLLSGLFLGLGYIWAAFEPRKRAWHDILAETVVIHAR